LEEQAPDPVDALTDLDARHDDLLRRLDELDQQVQEVLAMHQPRRAQAAPLPEAILPIQSSQPAISDAGPSAPTC